MRYVDQTVEEVQPDGTIALRKVIVAIPTKSDFPPVDELGMTIISVWGDPEEE